MTQPPHPLRAEFEALTARAGLTYPPDRQEAMFAAFLGYRALATRLDAPLPEALEPASLYIPATETTA